MADIQSIPRFLEEHGAQLWFPVESYKKAWKITAPNHPGKTYRAELYKRNSMADKFKTALKDTKYFDLAQPLPAGIDPRSFIDEIAQRITTFSPETPDTDYGRGEKEFIEETLKYNPSWRTEDIEFEKLYPLYAEASAPNKQPIQEIKGDADDDDDTPETTPTTTTEPTTAPETVETKGKEPVVETPGSIDTPSVILTGDAGIAEVDKTPVATDDTLSELLHKDDDAVESSTSALIRQGPMELTDKLSKVFDSVERQVAANNGLIAIAKDPRLFGGVKKLQAGSQAELKEKIRDSIDHDFAQSGNTDVTILEPSIYSKITQPMGIDAIKLRYDAVKDTMEPTERVEFTHHLSTLIEDGFQKSDFDKVEAFIKNKLDRMNELERQKLLGKNKRMRLTTVDYYNKIDKRRMARKAKRQKFA